MVLAAGLTGVGAFQAPEDKEAKGAREQVLQLAKEAEAGKKVTSKAAALGKRYEDLSALKVIYKARQRGGIGFGPRPTYGIEQKIIDVTKKVLSPADLKKESAELVRLAHINIVLAEATRAHTPAKDFSRMTPKLWIQYVGDMKKASQDLIKAVKASDAKGVKTAATRLNTSCNECHTKL
jgi:hypothetical protein